MICCARTSRASRNSGTGAVRTSGISACRMTSGNASAISRGPGLDDVVAGAERPGDRLLVSPLVVARVLEGDREGAQLMSVSAWASAVIRLESRPPER